MEAGYSCSDECGCEHCHRIQAAYDAQAARLAAVEQAVRALDVAFRLPQQEGGLLLAVLPVLQALRALDASRTDDYKEEEPCAQS